MARVLRRITGVAVLGLALLFNHGGTVHHRHGRRQAVHHVAQRRPQPGVLSPHDEWASMVQQLSNKWEA